MDPEPTWLHKRNVEVYTSEGAVVAGLWQYGTLQWDEFYKYITVFIVTNLGEPWAIFEYDPSAQHGALCPPEPQVVKPGRYVLLSNTGEPIRVGLEPPLPRALNPTFPKNPLPGEAEPAYIIRGRQRDGKCLITGLQTQMYSRLTVGHIFPRAYEAEWIFEGFPSKITDTADEASMGGPAKIDSLQNVITLRSDLYNAWANYEFGVDPTKNYRITAFTHSNEEIHGRHLHLDHIQNPTLRPLDELFTDHFKQGLYKHVSDTGERGLTYVECGDDIEKGLSNLSWGTSQGKDIFFELALRERLFDRRVAQELKDSRRAAKKN